MNHPSPEAQTHLSQPALTQNMMVQKIALMLLWLGFVGYAFLLAPPYQAETTDLIKNLVFSKLDGINPLIVSLFNLMGVWPLIYSTVLLIDGRGQKLPAWLFVVGSMAAGAFALLPYLILRQPYSTFTSRKSRLLKILDARLTGILIAIGGIALFSYGLTQGNWADFIQHWQDDRFIHVMGLDFCLLSVLFPILLRDDLARRGLQHSPLIRSLTLVPFFGALVYLLLRPPTQEVPVSEQPQTLASAASGQ